MATDRKSRIESVVWGISAVMVLVVLWHLSVVWTATRVFPSPAAVVQGVGELARTGLLGRYIRDSLLRVGGGYALAVIAAIPAGLLMGWYP
jgi:NitT/TauT family transport system permease protein